MIDMPSKTTTEIAAEMRELVDSSGLTPPEVQLLLLRTVVERFDQWLLWLDEHVTSDHGGDPCTELVLETIGLIRVKLHAELTIASDAAALVLA